MSGESATPLLRLRNVCKHYASSAAVPQVRVLADLCLEVQRGDTLAVIGPSGSGKSTILNIVGALDRPSSGDVSLNGRSIGDLDESAVARLRNKEIGFVFQAHHLLPQCSALENVLLPILAQPASNAERMQTSERAKSLLVRVGLGERLHHRPGQMSGGERQRVAVVRALINRPALLLADEPTGALDQENATALGKLLVELNSEEGTALIVVTHSMDLARQMRRVYELSAGRLKDWQPAR